MLPYIGLLLIVVFLSIIIPYNRKAGLILFIILGLFSGFRYNVGIDYASYLDVYQYIIEGYNVTNEPFFQYFIKAIDYLGFNAQFFFLISALFTQYFVYQSIKHLSKEFVLSTLIYVCIVSFYLFTFNVVRQWLGVSVFLYSLNFVVAKDYKRYFIYNLLAALFFHISLLFFLPLPFFLTKNLSKKTRFILVLVTIFCASSINYLISKTFYSNYILNESYSFESKIDYKIYLFLVLAIIIEGFRTKINRDNLSLLLLNCNFFSALIIIVLLFQDSSALILTIKRLHNYFLATYILLIPLIFSQFIGSKLKGPAIILASLVLCMLFILTVYFNGDVLKITPYQINLHLFK